MIRLFRKIFLGWYYTPKKVIDEINQFNYMQKASEIIKGNCQKRKLK